MSSVVSIIVPIYNAENTLHRCVDSLVNQSYQNLEILLVNDGSTDGTAKICNEYAMKDNRIKVLQQTNLGVSAARNKGLENVTGEYIAFVDADDELFPNAIQAMLTRSIQLSADLIVGATVSCAATGIERYEKIEKSDAVLYGDDLLILALEDHPYTYAVWRVLYKNSFVSDIRFIEGRVCNEDAFFMFQCALKKPVVGFVQEKVYRHIYNDKSVTRSGFSDKKYNDILFFLERKIEIIEHHYPAYSEKLYNVIVKCHMNLLQNMINLNDEQWKERKAKSLREFSRYQTYFIPAIKQDRRFYYILSYNLYELYSVLISIKKRIKFLLNSK